ncbi:MAG: exodeoxyribonuclease III [Spirochaetales bacterium]|nr:exodeoxyribonuclease III [Spirochaetales bacterium]
MRLKLISWNVNGLRAALRKGALDFLAAERPEVVCLQETRALAEEVPGVLPEFPYQLWNPAQRRGYSGTAVFSRLQPLSVRTGLGDPEHDGEGRVLTVELPKLFVVNVYTPNSQRGLTRLDYRLRWDRAFLRHLLRLERTKPVVFCGDLNVAHEELDLARPEDNRNTHGFTDQERRGFAALVEAGFVDTFRIFHPEGGHYTWWSLPTRARERNIGWRIDYVCVSGSLRAAVREAFIRPEVAGSDHCPVGVVLDLGRGAVA